MLFNSLQFLVFFPTVTALYFLLPHRHRWWLLFYYSQNLNARGAALFSEEFAKRLEGITRQPAQVLPRP